MAGPGAAALAASELSPLALPPVGVDLEEPLLGGAAAGAPRAAKPTQEALKLLTLGWPLVLEELLSYGSNVLALAMVGRLGGDALGVFALARSITNISGTTVFNGLTGGLETFCSQAAGAGNLRMVGLSTARAVLIVLLAFLPVMGLYLGMERVLCTLGQEPQLAAQAAHYVLLYSPAVALHAVVLCLYRSLIAQGAVLHVLAASTVLFALTAPLNWLLIFHLGWGLDGSAVAAVACEALYLLTMVGAVAVHNAAQAPHQRPWQRGWCSREVLEDWGPYLRVAIASLIMLVADWALFDVTTLLAGMLPSPDLVLATTGILYQIVSLSFMIPFGMAFAVGARVGNLLGAAQPQAAKLAAEVGTALGTGAMAALGAALLISPQRAAALLTSDPEVVRACAKLMLPVAVLLLANGGSAVLGGVLRGTRRQNQGAAANAATNWMVGLPLEILLAFKLGWGIAGLWWGLAAASVLQTVLLALLVACFDWGHQAQRAQRLVRRLSSCHD